MINISEQKILKILSDADEIFTAVKSLVYRTLTEDEVITSVGFNVLLEVFIVTIENNKEVGIYSVTIDEVIEELAMEGL